jgi:uncharacterized protein
MRVHIGESDRWGGKLLYEAIISTKPSSNFSATEGFDGATVSRDVGSYGSSSRYHTDKILRFSQDLPILIEVVEYPERIEKILPRLDELLDGGLITLEKAHVILYRPKNSEPAVQT